MNYNFDVEVAKEYGVDCAIMITNLQFWIAKSKVSKKHFYDGHYWTYNSTKAFMELFPFWTEKQIWLILDKLKRSGVIITGNYNQSAYDRTLWYAFVDEERWVFPNTKIDFTELKSPFYQMGRPIPDNKPDNKPDKEKEKEKEKETGTSSLPPSDLCFDFLQWWNNTFCKVGNNIPKISLFSAKRSAALKQRVKDMQRILDGKYPDEPKHSEDEAYENIKTMLLCRHKESKFLSGNTEKAFTLDVDFILQASSFLKIYEGKYNK